MMARLLRTTISAFNSSSTLNIQSDNQECMSPPSTLSAEVYVRCVCCVLLVALFSCLQIYTNRLRHVIAAFYNPKVASTCRELQMKPVFSCSLNREQTLSHLL
ncbi:uncharacterized protein LOC121815763 isoform X2 [Haplochromis burtoni]|uniref:uncharacterized protein LOC121815763 isoform X2 n=1 Tax=Haplochromis burtoni TaxID=8153 RepID=UPI0003BCC09E|nr:uncharacterized protein LOC121815763 isoform X2 [Haplochromis burtoni]